MRKLSKPVIFGLSIAGLIGGYFAWQQIRWATCKADKAQMLRIAAAVDREDLWNSSPSSERMAMAEKEYRKCPECYNWHANSPPTRAADNLPWAHYTVAIQEKRPDGSFYTNYVVDFDKCGSLVSHGHTGG